MPSPDSERVYLEQLFAYGAGLAVLAAVLFVLSRSLTFTVDLGFLRRIGVSGVVPRPEPMERFLYQAGLVLLPLLLGAFLLILRRSAWPGRLAQDPAREGLRRVADHLPALLSAAAVPVLVLPAVWNTAWARREGSWALLGLALTLPAAASLVRRGDGAGTGRGRGLPGILPHLGAGGVLLGLLLFCVFDLPQMDYGDIFHVSFEAYFSSVVQVAHGKQLLVNLGNQYGLYPHLLEPLFALTGLSVAKFTLVMGLLLAGGGLCVYHLLCAETRNRWLAFLGLSAVVFLCIAGPKHDKADYYFQYFPHRFVFPALSLLLVRRHLRRPSWRSNALVFLSATVAVLWNTDSGLVVLLAWVLLLAADGAGRGAWKRTAGFLAGGAAVAAGVTAAFAFGMRLRFGATPDLGRLGEAVKTYYLLGYNMVPMEPLHPWILVLAIYAAGILLALGALLRGAWTPRAGLLLYLALLGFGLFTQYQGRSVDTLLLAVSHPAIVMAAIFAGHLGDREAACSRAGRRALFRVLLAALVFSATALAASTPRWWGLMAAKLAAGRLPANQVVRNAAFVREHTRPGEEVLIVSPLASVYHLAAGTRSPLDIPGFGEIVFVRDYDAIIAHSRLGRKFFVDTWMGWAQMLLPRTAGRVAASPDGRFLVANPGR